MVRLAFALDPEDNVAYILQQILNHFEEAAQTESTEVIRLPQEEHDLNFFLELVGEDLKRFLTNSAEFFDRVQQFLTDKGIEVVYSRADS